MKRSVKVLWSLFFIGLLSVVGIFAAANFGLFGKMPSLRELENPEADIASEVMSADGILMGKYYNENRSEVKYSEISPNVVNAFIATEDERFQEHSGIDAEALGRVIRTFGKSGGSTISQQLAKMILGQGQGNVFVRGMQKLKEWIISVKLERNFTKEEIITLYLNRASWGNLFGIRNASLTFFQKEPIDLKLEEAAVLVGMLKGPSIYEPIRHAEASLNRRNTVLERMVVTKQHYLTAAEAAKYKAKPLVTNYKQIDENIGMAPHFRHVLIDVLKDWCKKNKNPKTGEAYNLFSDGLRIYTTIDSKMQLYAEEAMQAHMPNVQSKLNGTLRYLGDRLWRKHENTIEKAMKQTERWKNMTEDKADEATIRKSFTVPVRMKIFSWKKGGEKHEMDTLMTPLDSIKYHKKIMQTSFLAMDPRSGELKAWVGSIDYRWFKYDHVTAKRQVGSTFKPLVYTLAVQDVGYTPETYINGGPLTLSGKTISTGGGTCAYCLAHSINGCAWHLIGTIGVKRTIEFAKQCGIKAEMPPYHSIALGSAGIPMVEMLQAYTMFPNKGYNTDPVYVTRIEDKNGNLIHEFPTAVSRQVIGEGDAYTMVKMMQGVIKEGTAKRLNSYNIPAQKGGKTGTTNDNTDGWFIGYTPTLLAGTWVGCEDPFIPIYQNNAGGAEMAAPAWGNFMKKVYADKKFKMYSEQKEFTEPAELKNPALLADASFYKSLMNGDPVQEGTGEVNHGGGGGRRSGGGNGGGSGLTNANEEDGGGFFDDEPSADLTNPTEDAGGTITPPVEPAPTTTSPAVTNPETKKQPTPQKDVPAPPKKTEGKTQGTIPPDKKKIKVETKTEDPNDGGFGM
jgi:penicillin-binding protein 1A